RKRHRVGSLAPQARPPTPLDLRERLSCVRARALPAQSGARGRQVEKSGPYGPLFFDRRKGDEGPLRVLALVEPAPDNLLAALLVHEGRLAALLAQIADRLLRLRGHRQLALRL